MTRFFDILLSLFFLVILSPLFIIVAIWIMFDSKGKVIYTQRRIGKNSQPFSMLKFRTMYENLEYKSLLTLGSKDNRITKAGFLLRKYKLDELPQLYNVLAGDMSIVGPRPEVQKYVDLYNSEQQIVLSVKPGITDYASIMYADENELLNKQENPEQYYIDVIMPAKITLNMLYISNPSIGNYFKVIFLTIKNMLGGKISLS